MAKPSTLGRSFIARPKQKQSTLRMETWGVFRKNPETDKIEQFEVKCLEGTFPAAYRALGFDPIADMDAGRMMRELISRA